MDRFSKFSKKDEDERDILCWALIKECRHYVDYGINGFNAHGKMLYKKTLKLLLECDKNREYEYIYKDYPYFNELNNKTRK